MTTTFTRSSTDNPTNTVNEFSFDSFSNFPQYPRQVIEVSRRLGSNKVIRQNLGEESVETSSRALKGFDSYTDAASFIVELSTAQDPSTFYTVTSDNSLSINNVMVIDIQSSVPQYVKGQTSPSSDLSSDGFWLVEFTLITMVDN